MTRYQYVARLIPIRKQLEVVDRSEGRIVEWFDETCFALERKHPDRVAVLLDHDITPGRRMARHAPRPPRLADRHVPPRPRQQRRRRRPRPHPVRDTRERSGSTPTSPPSSARAGSGAIWSPSSTKSRSSAAALPPIGARRSPTGWHSRNEPNTQAPKRATSSSTAARYSADRAARSSVFGDQQDNETRRNPCIHAVFSLTTPTDRESAFLSPGG